MFSRNSQSFTAASTIFLSGILRPPRRPSSVVKTYLLWTLSIRSRRASELNPANTILCGAPIRTQASITNAVIGIIGMYIVTGSPFFTPYLIKTFAIREISRKHSLKVNFFTVPGSSPSQIIATSSPFPLSICLSIQLTHALILPPVKNATSPSTNDPVILCSNSLSHRSNFFACSPQNLAGSSMDSAYSLLYASMPSIFAPCEACAFTST
mmetsp:Transcript_26392/g.42793  ORF Transcript_26392/g.42793 Transcript_26392/m.42793 type:complete len:211 (+) Transcript_26392:1354-1986(+)